MNVTSDVERMLTLQNIKFSQLPGLRFSQFDCERSEHVVAQAPRKRCERGAAGSRGVAPGGVQGRSPPENFSQIELQKLYSYEIYDRLRVIKSLQ